MTTGTTRTTRGWCMPGLHGSCRSDLWVVVFCSHQVSFLFLGFSYVANFAVCFQLCDGTTAKHWPSLKHNKLTHYFHHARNNSRETRPSKLSSQADLVKHDYPRRHVPTTSLIKANFMIPFCQVNAERPKE